MIPFLHNKARAFWFLQTVGWLGFFLMRNLNGFARGFSIDYWKPSLVAMITGFMLTLLMRGVYRTVRDKSLPVVIATGLLMSTTLSVVFSTIETIGHVQLYDQNWNPRGLEFLGGAMFDAYVLLTWTVLYFIIHYYMLLEAETRKTLQATAMAHQAQLKMLRYQLNPHFLFNTLNAISTLVMRNDSDGAGGMLKKLSLFLRYTLVNQAAQKMSLAEEIKAIDLYLDIEKVRFQERLEIRFDIDDNAKDAMMPSLLLQPIVENAIKHAIAPSEDGGTITITARARDGRLTLIVCDTGPGLSGEEVADEALSTGVGLTNTHERLEELYGDDYQFELRAGTPSGLEVIMSLPLEYESKHEGPARRT